MAFANHDPFFPSAPSLCWVSSVPVPRAKVIAPQVEVLVSRLLHTLPAPWHYHSIVLDLALHAREVTVQVPKFQVALRAYVVVAAWDLCVQSEGTGW